MRAEADPLYAPDPNEHNTSSESEGQTAYPTELSDPAMRVLNAFAQAARKRSVEAVCSAYEDLRHACRGMTLGEVIALADSATRGKALSLVVSAYSHRQCFMCEAGHVACDGCDGTGQELTGRTCAHCDGLGLARCPFCRGTGWSDQQTIPAELRRAVRSRQLAHVLCEAAQLRRWLADHGQHDPLALPDDQRRDLHTRIDRLVARLTELRHGQEGSATQRKQMEINLRQFTRLLEQLTAPRDAPEPEPPDSEQDTPD